MKSSIGDQPDPLAQPIWEMLFEGLGELTRLAFELWSTGLPDGDLLLSFEKQLHSWAARLICDPLMGHVIKLAIESDGLKKEAKELVQQRPYARLQDSTKVVKVRLLGGTVQEVVVPYFLRRPPRGPGRPSDKRGPLLSHVGTVGHLW